MNKKIKKISTNELARMSQREFLGVRAEMHAGFIEVNSKIYGLQNTVEAGFESMSQTMKTILSELRIVREDVVELHDLRSRIERLEKKVGLHR